MDRSRVGYGQYCPISHALDVIGERWTLLVVRDLLTGTTRFNDLARGLPGLSRSLLAKRLRQLERAGIVEHLDGSYLLTPAGQELLPVVLGLGDWGARWTFEDPDPDELDAELLVWWMHTRVDTSALPGHRHVLAIRFVDDPRPFWIVIEAGRPSVCRTDPGYAVDATITAEVRALYEVWLGAQPLRHALRTGTVRVDGTEAWRRRLPDILQLSVIAPYVASARAAAPA